MGCLWGCVWLSVCGSMCDSMCGSACGYVCGSDYVCDYVPQWDIMILDLPVSTVLCVKVVINVGLCVALWDIVSLADSYIFPGDGSSHTIGKAAQCTITLHSTNAIHI